MAPDFESHSNRAPPPKPGHRHAWHVLLVRERECVLREAVGVLQPLLPGAPCWRAVVGGFAPPRCPWGALTARSARTGRCLHDGSTCGTTCNRCSSTAWSLDPPIVDLGVCWQDYLLAGYVPRKSGGGAHCCTRGHVVHPRRGRDSGPIQSRADVVGPPGAAVRAAGQVPLQGAGAGGRGPPPAARLPHAQPASTSSLGRTYPL